MPLRYDLIRIFTSEEARWHGRPLHEAVVQRVADLHVAARCIVLRGMAGCDESGEVASPRVEVLSLHMPLEIHVVLPAAETERLLPMLEEMVGEGIVLLQEAQAVVHRTSWRLLPRLLRVRDVMTPSPVAVLPAAPVSDVVRLLLGVRYHGVPVVDEAQRVLGMLTQRDLIRRAGMPVRLGLLRLLDRQQVDAHLATDMARTVGEVMSQPAVTVGADAPLSVAVELMLERELKRLPAVDAEGRLQGMLCRVDVFRAVTRRPVLVPPPVPPGAAAPEARLVREVMQRDAHAVAPDTPLEEVVRRIDEDDVQRLAVVDPAGRLLGLVFDHDLLAAFVEHRHGLWDYIVRRLSSAELRQRHVDLYRQLQSLTARQVMQTEIVSVTEEMSIDEAIRLMAQRELKRIPVVDDGGIFRGMISRDAVLRAGAAAQATP